LPGKGELRSECDKDCAGKPERHAHRVGVYEFQPQAETITTSSAFLPLDRLAKKITRFIILRKPRI
jgi:hypothetical protein